MLSCKGKLFINRHSLGFIYTVDNNWYSWGEVFTSNPEYAFLHKRGWILALLPRIIDYRQSSPLEFLLVTGFDFYDSLQEIWLSDEK